MIEAAPIYQLIGKDSNHSQYSGYMAFVNFVPDSEGYFA
jgi:hypothetical protein